MQRLKLSLLIFASIGSLFLTACKKEIVELNKVPAVDAGTHQTITTDVDLTLSGTAADEDGHVVAYLWSQVSGPVPGTIVSPGSPTTIVKDLVNGDYVFQLMATDNDGATGVDTVSVKINRPTEKTVILQPANNAGEYKLQILGSTNQSHSGSGDFTVAAWTNGGTPVTLRQLLKFDLSGIPASATIKSANLYLYSYPPPTLNGNFTDANFGSDNSFTIQQVTANWTPGTTTWASQPATTATNQVVVPHTASSALDLNLDVKGMVSSMVATNNYGFFMKLNNEVIYTSRIFVSSNTAAHPAKHPKLVVVYE